MPLTCGMKNTKNNHAILPAWVMVLLLLLSLPCSSSFAGSGVVEIYDLDDLDGFAESVAKIMPPSVVQAMMTQGVPPDIIATARAIADKSFSAEQLQSHIREALMTGLTDEHVDSILEWRKTTLGHLVSVAENQHNAPDYTQKLRAYSVSEELYSVTDKRRLMVIELYDSMNAINQSVEMIINANYAMALATAIANGDDAPDEKTMREVYDSIAESRDQIAIGVRGRMLVTGLYVYRGISDEELANYMEFNMTEAGEKYNQIIFHTVDRWLFDSTKRFGFRFGRALREINAQQPA